LGIEDRKANNNLSDNKNRQAGKRSYEEICRSYENMFAFDWELKDINNKSHPPGKSSVYGLISALLNYHDAANILIVTQLCDLLFRP